MMILIRRRHGVSVGNPTVFNEEGSYGPGLPCAGLRCVLCYSIIEENHMSGQHRGGLRLQMRRFVSRENCRDSLPNLLPLPPLP